MLPVLFTDALAHSLKGELVIQEEGLLDGK
jgi:hypothetical protein